MRAALRLERGQRGERDDVETGLLDSLGLEPTRWEPTPLPPPDAYVHEHGHVLADLEHLLLQDQVRLRDGGVEVVSTLRLEGHVMRSLAPHLHKAGPPGRTLHRGTDLAWKQAHEVADIFADPKARREFALAVRHPDRMTPRQQRALLFLVLTSSVWVWMVGAALLLELAPGLGAAWSLAFTLYFAALGTNLFLPIPMEPLALAAVGTLGTGVTVFASAAGKAAGAWIIYALGAALRRGVRRLEERSATTRRVMAAAERFARRFGYAALGAMLAVPFSPFDIVPVYLFSGLGLRLAPFLAAVFVGFGLRLLAVLWLGEALLGGLV